jgi:uroporphyrin-III C-methyltransferase/precorrin-2 dehydrogenase/sirohydrochlorin ferrochelatase
MSLPLALDVDGRLVVAVGGGPVSARRVRAFVGEGAVVRVVAPWLCEDLADLLAEGRIIWVDRDYAGPSDLDGAWLVHTAVGEPAVDRLVTADAAALRLWCVDATSAATTPAAVLARGAVETPDGRVTVAVHADGDPRLAASVRNAVSDALSSGRIPLRRSRTRARGWVALVGGGPGSDDLLTARGHELLAAADVVVVDRLAPRGLLSRLSPEVRVIDVGKTPGHHAVPQDRINDVLVEEALAGNAVVRLKGGDPYVLGRGGEERLACEAAGVPVEVVPGVTSAIAVPAAAGIPVTHRGVAKAFTMVTGHEDVPTLPTGSDHTLVMLMGVANLARTCELLIASGRDPRCPVAVVERGFSPTQRTTVGHLDSIASVAAAVGVENPAVVVIGDVVRLSPEAAGLD